jgi:hypothetical protein
LEKFFKKFWRVSPDTPALIHWKARADKNTHLFQTLLPAFVQSPFQFKAGAFINDPEHVSENPKTTIQPL